MSSIYIVYFSPNRLCKNMRELSSLDSEDSGLEARRVRAFSSSCLALTLTGYSKTYWLKKTFVSIPNIQVCWSEDRGLWRAAPGDPHQGQRHHQRGRRRVLPGERPRQYYGPHDYLRSIITQHAFPDIQIGNTARLINCTQNRCKSIVHYFFRVDNIIHISVH